MKNIHSKALIYYNHNKQLVTQKCKTEIFYQKRVNSRGYRTLATSKIGSFVKVMSKRKSFMKVTSDWKPLNFFTETSRFPKSDSE